MRDCCALEMPLRDRQEETSHHRRGGRGNRFVERLSAPPLPATRAALLDSLEILTLRFDTLAGEWSGSYVERRWPLLDAIAQGRQEYGPERSPAR